MREPDADLGEALPEVTLLVRTRLPAGLQDLVGGERSTLADQLTGPVEGLGRGQRLLGDRLDAGRAVGKRAAEGVPRTLLAGAAGGIPVPVGHRSVSSASSTRSGRVSGLTNARRSTVSPRHMVGTQKIVPSTAARRDQAR